MANSSLCLVLASSFMVLSLAAGTQFKVGGSGRWSAPDNNAMTYNQWAEKNRFKIGDSIVFTYLPDEDSVLLVDDDVYKSCNTSSHIDQFNDGNTVFTFTHSGNFYFVSGVKDNCDKNEKLHVVVLGDRTNKSSPAPAPLPASPPAEGATGEPSPPPNAAAAKVVGVVSSLGAAAIAALSFTF
ncbi:early nodulin-like protein 1 [Zingiber officinale]|uniref:Phytocyanin domain-containing protein n=1 Tax=Zingiber officinale TaxID=94328 RepID=A0A8J5BX33_ZINOF|nr:early nodulin-like protein 1 [Zingiber officinale]KAG6469293.1 hypothetical protein ZIOFF_074001 [Zingiber officinale]